MLLLSWLLLSPPALRLRGMGMAWSSPAGEENLMPLSLSLSSLLCGLDGGGGSVCWRFGEVWFASTLLPSHKWEVCNGNDDAFNSKEAST